MDRTTKIILAIIAAGLWANAAVTIFKVSPAAAQDLSSYATLIQTSVMDIANGSCTNPKICGPVN